MSPNEAVPRATRPRERGHAAPSPEPSSGHKWHLAALQGLVVAHVVAWAGCDMGPRKSTPPQGPPTPTVATQPASAPASAPASQPASAPATQPTSSPAEVVEVVDEPPPEFVRVQSRGDVGKKSRVLAKIESPGRLTIDTDNVTQLQIRRDLLDLPRNRSTLLYLDGQLFEWTPNSKVTEFRRSPAGVWSPVHGR